MQKIVNKMLQQCSDFTCFVLLHIMDYLKVCFGFVDVHIKVAGYRCRLQKLDRWDVAGGRLYCKTITSLENDKK